MLDFVGDRHRANVDDRKKAITVQNLLDMTSGIEWEEGIEGGREQTLHEFGRSANQIQFVLDRPMAHVPGDVFNYNSGNPHLLSAIITGLTGVTAWDYAKAKLFAPLGIGASRWWHHSRASRPEAAVSSCTRAIWPRSAISIYAKACGRISSLFRRTGRTGKTTPPST